MPTRSYILEQAELLDKKLASIPGGLADNLTLRDIAKKHKRSVEFMVAQARQGIKVEKEHVGDDENMALEIATDHLFEDPDYYIKLKKIE